MIKTDVFGNELWNRTYGGSGDEYGFEVEVLNDGGYILCGKSTGLEDSVILIKTDLYGNIIWNKRFASGQGWAVEQLPSNTGFIVTGSTFIDSSKVLLIKTDVNGNLLWSKTYMTGDARDLKLFSDGIIIIGNAADLTDNGFDLMLLKTDLEGNFIWSKKFNTSTNALWSSIDTTDDKGFILAGGDNYPAPFGEARIMKTDGQGNELWSKSFGGIAADKAFSVFNTSDGSYVAAGDQGCYPDSVCGMMMVKYDTDGDLQWKRIFENGYYGNSVIQTVDGGYVSLGRTNTTYLEVDFYLVKTDENGFVSTNELEFELLDLAIVPNPFSEETKITFSKNSFKDLTIFVVDIFGKRVLTIDHVRDNVLTIQKGTLVAGIYLLNIYERHRLINSQKLVLD